MKFIKLASITSALILSSIANASLIGTGYLREANSPQLGLDYSYEVSIGLTSNSYYFNEAIILFYSSRNEAGINGEGIKNRYSLNSGIEFDNAVLLLTNGENNFLQTDSVEWVGQNGTGGGIGSPEFAFFNLTDNDFSGIDISNIDLVIDGANTRLEIHSVPVPSAFWLFFSGLLSLLGINKINNNKQIRK